MLLEQYLACLAANRDLASSLNRMREKAGLAALIIKDYEAAARRWKTAAAAGWLVAAGLAVYVIFGG